MCGRYQFTLSNQPEALEILQQIHTRQPDWEPGEIFPQSQAPILLWETDKLSPILQTWGFPGIQGKGVVINARAETAQQKLMFRESLETRRCVIPTTGFFEWTPEKEKILFSLPNEQMVYLAGFYKLFNGTPRYCILTTQANETVRPVHHRMPIVLPRQKLTDWLAESQYAMELLHQTPIPLERTTVSGQTTLW